MDAIQLPAKATHRDVVRLWPHPDGQTLVALTGADLAAATLTWWDVAAGKRVRAARVLGGREVAAPAFAPDHSWYVAGCEVRPTTAAHVRLPLVMRGPNEYGRLPYSAFAFAPDGATLFAMRQYRDWTDPGTIDRWALTPAGPVIGPPVVVGDEYWLKELVVTPGGRTLFALDRWYGVFRFPLPDGDPLPRPAVWVGDRTTGLEISPDGETLAVTDDAGTNLLDPHTSGPPRAVLPGRLRGSAFTLDSRRIVTAEADGTAAVWDVATGECVARYDWSVVAGPLHAVAVAPDGLTAYVGGSGGRIVRWDLPE